MRKFPQITISFWIMKICATTLGETAGDLLSMTMHIGYVVNDIRSEQVWPSDVSTCPPM